MPTDLAALLGEIRACTHCEGLPLGPRPILQAGQGARILLVGQAPGRITHAKGIPFDDPSGTRLRAWLGVDRARFYDPDSFAIVPMGFCFPGGGKGGDAPPRPECAALWREKLLACLPPTELTLVMGGFAQAWHVPHLSAATLTERVAAWRDLWPKILVLPHPSPRNQGWFKANPWFEAEVVPALQARVAMLLAA